jgi:hypothetical protein
VVGLVARPRFTDTTTAHVIDRVLSGGVASLLTDPLGGLAEDLFGHLNRAGD